MEDKGKRQDARSTRIVGSDGDVRRAAIRALPKEVELKPEFLVFEPGASGIYSGCYNLPPLKKSRLEI